MTEPLDPPLWMRTRPLCDPSPYYESLPMVSQWPEPEELVSSRIAEQASSSVRHVASA